MMQPSAVGFCRAIAQAVKSCAPRKRPQKLYEDCTLLSGKIAFRNVYKLRIMFR